MSFIEPSLLQRRSACSTCVREKRYLDVGCGNGQFARRMAALGANVVALDVSSRMIENARASAPEDQDRIEYRVMDATDRTALIALGEERFDAAVCTMAMMDMASIDPMLASLRRLLKPISRFVFSVCHPCFNSGTVRLVAEEETSEAGVLVMRYSVTMSEYIYPRPKKGVAMRGQPLAQVLLESTDECALQCVLSIGLRPRRHGGADVPTIERRWACELVEHYRITAGARGTHETYTKHMTDVAE